MHKMLLAIWGLICAATVHANIDLNEVSVDVAESYRLDAKSHYAKGYELVWRQQLSEQFFVQASRLQTRASANEYNEELDHTNFTLMENKLNLSYQLIQRNRISVFVSAGVIDTDRPNFVTEYGCGDFCIPFPWSGRDYYTGQQEERTSSIGVGMAKVIGKSSVLLVDIEHYNGDLNESRLNLSWRWQLSRHFFTGVRADYSNEMGSFEFGIQYVN